MEEIGGGERYSPGNFSSRTAFNEGSVMVWSGISLEGRTELVFIEKGALTASRYIVEVLENHGGQYTSPCG